MSSLKHSPSGGCLPGIAPQYRGGSTSTGLLQLLHQPHAVARQPVPPDSLFSKCVSFFGSEQQDTGEEELGRERKSEIERRRE